MGRKQEIKRIARQLLAGDERSSKEWAELVAFEHVKAQGFAELATKEAGRRQALEVGTGDAQRLRQAATDERNAAVLRTSVMEAELEALKLAVITDANLGFRTVFSRWLDLQGGYVPMAGEVTVTDDDSDPFDGLDDELEPVASSPAGFVTLDEVAGVPILSEASVDPEMEVHDEEGVVSHASVEILPASQVAALFPVRDKRGGVR